MSTRLCISVEGPTEESFVNEVLSPYLFSINKIFVEARNLRGNISINKAKKDLKNLVHSFDKVSTLYDFYGFKGNQGHTKETLEDELISGFSESEKSKIIPYIQMYEYEGLLFSEPSAMASTIPENKNIESWANSILSKFKNQPETINNSPEQSPSKRLLAQKYKKTMHGHLIAKNTGIPKIKEMCPNFKDWVEKLEQL